MESLTRPAHKKKLSQVGGSRGGYDGVFSSPEVAQRFTSPATVADYTEIFGGATRGSSIPVLDLSGLDEKTQTFRRSKVDYAKIFGGFEDDLALPYEELLTRSSEDTKVSGNKGRNHPEKEFPPQGADTFNRNSEKHPSEASIPSSDAMKQFNMSYLKTSPGNKNQPNGTTHVAKLHAVSGFTYFVNEPPSKQKIESGVHIPPIKSEVNRTWSFSSNVPDEHNRKTEMLFPGNPPAVGASGAKAGSERVRSQSKDRSFNGSESFLKSQSFKAAPSSNHPLEPSGIRGHPKRSKSSNVSSKANPFEKSTGNGTDGSDEEFDINSEAAACAAALKRVLEKAQESIRLAKEIRERGEKDGIQRFSNLSSKRSSKAKDKKNGFNAANSSRTQTVKDLHERLGSQLHESNVANKRLGSTSTGVSTASEHIQELLTSTEAANVKSPNTTEVVGKSRQFIDPTDIRKDISSILASDQAEMDKRTTLPSTRKQESATSLSLGKQESVVGETAAAETLEQIENNAELEKSTEKDFGKLKVENNEHVVEQTQVSEVAANASGSASVKHEFRTSVGLEITEKDARSEDMKCILDELTHHEIKSPECLRMTEENKSESFNIDYQCMLSESQNLAQEEEPCEDFQQVQLELSFIHSQEEKENGLFSCNEGGMIHQEACGFVAIDSPKVCGGGSHERPLKDSQEGEACGTSNGPDSFSEGGMVQQESSGFVVSDDAPEVCGGGSHERTHKGSQEGEACGTSNAIQEIGAGYSELISEHKEDEAPTVSQEELNKKVVGDLHPNEKNLAVGQHVEQSMKVPKEEHQEGEHQKRSEETNNNVKAGLDAFGEESDWGEVEKRIKKECITEDTEMIWSEKDKISASQIAVERIQEAEETTGVHLENDNFDNDECIELLQKAAQDKNLDADAYSSLYDVLEVHSTVVVEDHESSNSTTGTSEEFYNCESEGNSEEGLKACELENLKLEDKSDCVQCHFEDGVGTSETPVPFMAVESDGNGTNADDNGSSHEDKLPQEEVIETTYLVQNAETDDDIWLKLQDVSKDQKAKNVAFAADRRGTVTDENIKEPERSVNPERGCDFLYSFRENAEHVNEEVSFNKEAEDVDPKVACQVENKENEMDQSKSSAVPHQATVNHGYVEEIITGQNILFVKSKPEKNVLPEKKEARESSQKDLKEKEHFKKVEAMKKEREREDRIAVERAIREARERAFAEARERAERVAVARAGAEVRQRMMTEAREKLEKASSGTKLADKASIIAKQRAERAAVERATAEARERALEKALSQKSTAQGRVQPDRLSGTPKESSLKHSFSSSDIDMFDENNSDSAQRRKAKLERHERIMERAAKALAEKNTRDLQAQKEQAERNRLADSLDADVKRWANGKEGNLRALISTLQYILGHDSGWQPISLTELITTAAVKKGYRKATLYVHPDKLQQRGASIQQKYVCEKVFDLLKVAWTKFNSEER